MPFFVVLSMVVRVRGLSSPPMILSMVFSRLNAAGVAFRSEKSDEDLSSSSSSLPLKFRSGGGMRPLLAVLWLDDVVGKPDANGGMSEDDDDEEVELDSDCGDVERRARVTF